MKQHNDFIVFLSICCLFALAWTGFNSYHNYITSKIPESLQTQITPINPSFDTKTLENITKRKKIDPNLQARTSVSTTPIPSRQPVASGSASSQSNPRSGSLLPSGTQSR